MSLVPVPPAFFHANPAILQKTGPTAPIVGDVRDAEFELVSFHARRIEQIIKSIDIAVASRIPESHIFGGRYRRGIPTAPLSLPTNVCICVRSTPSHSLRTIRLRTQQMVAHSPS